MPDGVKPSADTAWWLCAACRLMPQRVQSLTMTVMQLQQFVTTLLQSQTQLTDTVAKLVDANNTLSTQVLLAQFSPPSSQQQPCQPSRPSLLVGDMW